MNNSVIDLEQYKWDQAEKDLRLKLVDFSHRQEIQKQIGEAFYIWKNNPEATEINYTDEDVDDVSFTKFFDWFLHDFKLIDVGKSVIELFYENDSETLSVDERSILKDWIDNVYSYFVIEHIDIGEGCRIKDIFTNEVCFVTDTSSSKQLKITDIIGARPLKTGNNTYFSGVISVYPHSLKPLILDFFKREFNEFKKIFGKNASVKDLLKDWGFLIANYIEIILQDPRFLTPEGDEFVLATADYKLTNTEKVLAKLTKIKAIQEIGSGTSELRVFIWSKPNGNNILATIEIEGANLRLNSHSLNSLNKAKTFIENRLKGLLNHKRDFTKQLESIVKDNSLGKTKPKKLPLGVRSRKEMDSVLDEYYNDWIDEPNKALNGKSPREAIETKQDKKRLITMLAELEHLYKHAKQRGEPYYDIGKLRKKLRL